jgi:hypothetical protein
MRSVDHQSEQPSSSAMRPDSAVASTGSADSRDRCHRMEGQARAATFGDRGFDPAAHKGHWPSRRLA